ncbi:hypothetical protein BGX38DRAFT_542047 [Terfezia claveryi]|nr:hypothetical protein BGX38DRAFT_542047 [Terfezia claveryi]
MLGCLVAWLLGCLVSNGGSTLMFTACKFTGSGCGKDRSTYGVYRLDLVQDFELYKEI